MLGCIVIVFYDEDDDDDNDIADDENENVGKIPELGWICFWLDTYCC